MKDGIRDAGGIAFEFPVHPHTGELPPPTAALDRNLAYLGIVEILCGYPLDGVVLMTGCDKTTPACLMAASTVNMPAIVLSGGPMLDGYYKASWPDREWRSGKRAGCTRPERSAIRSDRNRVASRPARGTAIPWARRSP